MSRFKTGFYLKKKQISGHRHLVSISLLPNDLVQTVHLCNLDKVSSPVTEIERSRCREAMCLAKRSCTAKACK